MSRKAEHRARVEEERFVQGMFLVSNPSKHWLAHRIVGATRASENRVELRSTESSAPSTSASAWNLRRTLSPVLRFLRR